MAPETCGPPPAADCWLHPDVEVRLSPIEGRGLFTGAAIPAGTVVSRLGGRLVSGDELQRLFADPDRSYIDTITVGADTHLVLPPRRDNGCGNHSCDPNLCWVGPYELAARRDLVPGEELTNDYATSTADPAFTMPCDCRAALCRGTVTGNTTGSDPICGPGTDTIGCRRCWPGSLRGHIPGVSADTVAYRAA